MHTACRQSVPPVFGASRRRSAFLNVRLWVPGFFVCFFFFFFFMFVCCCWLVVVVFCCCFLHHAGWSVKCSHDGNNSIVRLCLCCLEACFQAALGRRAAADGLLHVHKLRPLGFHRLVGLVVKESASRAEDPGFQSRLRRDFFGSCHTSDLKMVTPVATLPGHWRDRVSAGTGRPSVSILWLGEAESFICNFYLSVAARTIIWAHPSLRYSSMLLGR